METRKVRNLELRNESSFELNEAVSDSLIVFIMVWETCLSRIFTMFTNTVTAVAHPNIAFIKYLLAKLD